MVCPGGALSPAQENLFLTRWLHGPTPMSLLTTAADNKSAYSTSDGERSGGMKVFNRCGWQAEPDSGTSLPHQYSLMAGQGVPGKGD